MVPILIAALGFASYLYGCGIMGHQRTELREGKSSALIIFARGIVGVSSLVFMAGVISALGVDIATFGLMCFMLIIGALIGSSVGAWVRQIVRLG